MPSDVDPVPPTRAWRRLELLGVVAILLVAYLFRASVTNSGIPSTVFGRHDEIHYVPRVIDFLNDRWDIQYFTNPTLAMYLIYAASVVSGWLLVLFGSFESFSHFTVAASLDPYYVTIIGRGLSIVLAVASVGLLYRIARKMFSARVALVAGIALAVNQTHTLRSILAGSESPLVFMVLLFFLAVLRYMEAPSAGRHALCGILLGVACSTKYSAAIHVLTLGMASLITLFGAGLPGLGQRILRPGRWLLGFLLVPISAAACSPQALVYTDEFLQAFRNQAAYLHEGYTGRDVLANQSGFAFYLAEFPRYMNGLPFALCCALGVGLALYWAVQQRDSKALLLLSAALPTYLFLGSGIFTRMRFLLPAVPFIFLLGAWGLDRAAVGIASAVARWTGATAERARAWGPPLALTLSAAVLVPNGMDTYGSISAAYGRPGPRTDLYLWVQDRLEPGEVYLEFTPRDGMGLHPKGNPALKYGLVRHGSISEEARKQLQDHHAQALRARPLGGLLLRSSSLEQLARNIEKTGCRHLLMVLRPEEIGQLAELPNRLRDPAVRKCAYWDELVEYLDKLERTEIHVAKGTKFAPSMAAYIITLR